MTWLPTRTDEQRRKTVHFVRPKGKADIEMPWIGLRRPCVAMVPWQVINFRRRRDRWSASETRHALHSFHSVGTRGMTEDASHVIVPFPSCGSEGKGTVPVAPFPWINGGDCMSYGEGPRGRHTPATRLPRHPRPVRGWGCLQPIRGPIDNHTTRPWNPTRIASIGRETPQVLHQTIETIQ